MKSKTMEKTNHRRPVPEISRKRIGQKRITDEEKAKRTSERENELSENDTETPIGTRDL